MKRSFASIGLLTVVLTLGPPAQAAFPGSNGSIAFADGNGALFTVDGSGGISALLAEGVDPGWSPDGTKIAYAKGFREDIYVANADGTGEVQLTNDPGRDIHPSWSPDGTQIVFASGKERIGLEGGFDLWSAEVATGALRRLTSNLGGDWHAFQPAWSPDGTTIAFALVNQVWTIPAPAAGGGPGPYPIVVRNPDATAPPDPNATKLTCTGDPLAACASAFASPSWSPDGTKIAVLANQVTSTPTDANWTVNVIDADGKNPRLLSFGALHPLAAHVSGRGTEAPAWSPDGDQIAYVTTGGLQVTDSAGLGPARLLAADGHDPDWQPLAANTPRGAPVIFGPSEGVTLRFDQVGVAGNTTITRSQTGPAAPAGFKLGDPPTYYEISTTANFIGSVLVCIDTTGITFSGAPVLMHYENGGWANVTQTPVTLPIVCGRVNSLSPFAVFVPSANSTPSVPGVPFANPNPNAGVFDLSWAPSHDEDGTALEYLIEHMDANDGGFTLYGNTLNLTSVQLGSSALPVEEGTWVYRVQALDFGDPRGVSGFSAASEPVKVDKSAPNPPRISADRPADHADWYRDSVTVSFASDGDPLLLDGSTGSGVDPPSVPPPAVVSASGSHTVGGSIKDRVGNESARAELTVKIDADAPTVSILCPGSVVLGSTASADWTASDEHSGLTTPASGSFALDRSSVGTKTATSPVARDNVGHEATASCTYQVVYDFAGFFRPVDNLPTLNSVNAGRAIPVKFSLGGNHGLDVLAAGYPKSEPIACDSNAAVDGIDETLTAGSSSLTYDAASGHYVYVWKTDSAWAGTCRQLVLKLNDGTYHRANFKFK